MSFALSFYGLGGAVKSPDMLPLLIGPPGPGAGTVTTVSVVTANGISGSVANATSTPAITLTLATVNGNVGSFGSATQVGTFTVNAKGLIEAASNVTITPDFASLTGKPTTISGYGITDAVTNGNNVNLGLANSSNTIVNVGQGATGNKFAVIDLIGDTTYTDAGLRVGRANDGANGTSIIQHRGTGGLIINAVDAGYISFATNDLTRATIASDGSQTMTTATTASAANLFQSASGAVILRSTSSRRYKHNIERVLPEYSNNVLNLEPVWYQSTAEADNPNHGFWGLIAEEVAKIDPRLVHFAYLESDYDIVEVAPATDAVFDDVMVEISPPIAATYSDDGQEVTPAIPAKHRIETAKVAPAMPPRYERRLKHGAVKVPDGVQYDRIIVLLLDVAKRLEARVAALEAALLRDAYPR